MFCQKCGHEILDNAKFCKDCGFGVSGIISNGKFPSSALRRLANYLIDRILGGIVFGVVIVIVWGIISVLSKSGVVSPESAFVKIINTIIPVLIVLSIYINPLYYLFFEGIWGRTLGKWITKTKVVRMDGSKPKFVQILGRSFARLIPFEAFSFLISNNPVGWHDRLSKTLVVPSEYTVDDVKKIDFNESKKQKTALIIVAVLIGLFFFIAVIGILSSVVLTSLSSARAKAQDASIKANLSGIMPQAILYWDSQSVNGKDSSYFGLCKNDIISQMKSTLTVARSIEIVCNDSNESYAISAPLNSGGYWCVDSAGESKEINTTIGTSTSCSSFRELGTSSTAEETLKSNFINGCVSESSNYSFCSCSFDSVFKKLGADEFIAMSNRYDKTGVLEPGVKDSFTNCAYLLK